MTLVSCGTFSSSTMIVMMIASTPSLKASMRDLPMLVPRRADDRAQMRRHVEPRGEQRRLESHPVVLDAREQLRDHVVARVRPHECQHAGRVAFVLVARPGR